MLGGFFLRAAFPIDTVSIMPRRVCWDLPLTRRKCSRGRLTTSELQQLINEISRSWHSRVGHVQIFLLEILSDRKCSAKIIRMDVYNRAMHVLI